MAGVPSLNPSQSQYLNLQVQLLHADHHQVVAGCVLAGVEQLLLLPLPTDQVRTVARYTNTTTTGHTGQLYTVTEGGDQHLAQQAVLHWQTIKHKGRFCLLTK